MAVRRCSFTEVLDLHNEPDDNRRVLAVLGWLEAG